MPKVEQEEESGLDSHPSLENKINHASMMGGLK